MTTAATRYGGVTYSDRPTCVGVAGRAWAVPLISPDERRVPDHRSTVAGWMLDVPAAHPFWKIYSLGILHLRPIAGVRPAIVRTPGATHELMILAVDPGSPLPSLAALGRCETPFRWLSPIDVMEQFTVQTDAHAYRLGELAVRAIVDGLLSPDQDYRGAWRRVIAATADHLRRGLHMERIV